MLAKVCKSKTTDPDVIQTLRDQIILDQSKINLLFRDPSSEYTIQRLTYNNIYVLYI